MGQRRYNLLSLVHRFPRLLQPSCRPEVELLLSECSQNWRTLTRCRLSVGVHLRDFLDRAANRLFAVTGLPDLAMEEFRGIASAHGSLVMRDALLDEMFHPLPDRRSVDCMVILVLWGKVKT